MSRLGSLSLSVAQLREYLNEMQRFAEEYEKRVKEARQSKDMRFWEFENGVIVGIRMATAELLMALGLPRDWAEEMDKVEREEDRASSPVEVTRVGAEALRIPPPEVTRPKFRIKGEKP